MKNLIGKKVMYRKPYQPDYSTSVVTGFDVRSNLGVDKTVCFLSFENGEEAPIRNCFFAESIDMVDVSASAIKNNIKSWIHFLSNIWGVDPSEIQKRVGLALINEPTLYSRTAL